MDASYTIGALARAAGVPTTTLRYYERRGLLRANARLGSGSYRSYRAEHLERLHFIRAAQSSGFALDDVSTLLSLRDETTEPCAKVKQLVEARLDDVAQRVRDLQRVERELKTLLRGCTPKKRRGRCEVIESLSAGSAERHHSRPRATAP